MIILTERLQAIADNITELEGVADIGTDHGYLPLYLYERNKKAGTNPNMILTDVSKGSLDKARENVNRLVDISSSKDKGKIELRLGDGLEVLERGEVDTVVMAGIGGLLMKEIMEWDIGKTLSFKKYILQPRNNLGILMKYLYELGIKIENFIIAKEDRRLCEIIVCRTPDNLNESCDPNEGVLLGECSDLDLEFPETIVSMKGPYTLEYLEDKLKLERRIVDNIAKGREATIDELSEDPDIKIRQARIERIETLISKYMNVEE